jgi:hypothetical protein
MKWSTVSLAGAVILLLLADMLAFHDLFEPHTIRDWMMLAASALAVVSLGYGSAGLLRVLTRRS